MKDDIFVLHQPKYAILSIVLANSKFPLSEKQHNQISKLEEFSDVFFIFSDTIFPESSRVDKNKFASLYEGCGWINGGDNLCQTFLKTLLYSLEIFETHVGFCIINMDDLEYTDVENYVSNIRSITASSSTNPVFKIERLGSEEFYDIYLKKNSGVFKKSNPIENMYCSYTSPSKILYFKRSTAGTFIDFWRSSENNSYINSFSQSDIRYFIASMTKFLTLQTIDSSIYDLDIGRL